MHMKKHFLLSAALLLTLVSIVHGQTVTLPNPLGGTNSIMDILNKILDALIIFAAPVVTVVVVWAGFMFLRVGEDPENITRAKNTIIYAVVGYGIILIAKGIGAIIQSLFSQ